MTGAVDSLALLREVVTAVEAGEPVVLATIVESGRSTPAHSGAKILVHPDGRCSGTIGGGAVEAAVAADALRTLANGSPRLARYDLGELGMCPGELTVYLEPQLPPATVLVVGCGHVGRAVVELAHWLGFRVVAVDDRAELVTRSLLPDADELVSAPLAEALGRIGISDRTHVVLATRSSEADLEALPLVLASPAASIGVLGGRHRWGRTRDALAATASAEQLARVHAPIGLDIGARTPREIALAILGELLALRDRP